MATIVGPAGHVYAFEPNESTRERLRGAIDANGLRQVTIDSRALSDRIGITGFEAPQAGDVWDGTGRMTGAPADGGSGMSVECMTLDAFVAERGIDRLDLIKIDVEGWEQTVLRGAPRHARPRSVAVRGLRGCDPGMRRALRRQRRRLERAVSPTRATRSFRLDPQLRAGGGPARSARSARAIFLAVPRRRMDAA